MKQSCNKKRKTEQIYIFKREKTRKKKLFVQKVRHLKVEIYWPQGKVPTFSREFFSQQ